MNTGFFFSSSLTFFAFGARDLSLALGKTALALQNFLYVGKTLFSATMLRAQHKCLQTNNRGYAENTSVFDETDITSGSVRSMLTWCCFTQDASSFQFYILVNSGPKRSRIWQPLEEKAIPH